MIYTKYKLKNCEYKQQIRNFAFCIDNEKFLIYDWLVPQVRTRGRWKMQRFSDWLVEKLEDCDVWVILVIQIVLSIVTASLTSVLTVLLVRQLRMIL